MDLDSSPKGIKIDGEIVINDGNVNISVTGVSDGSEGMESKSELTINGGDIYIYAYDDAINASKGITFNGGTILGIGGTSMTSPSSSSQRVVIYGGISVSKNEIVSVLDANSKPIMSFTIPRSYNGATLFLSSPSIAANITPAYDLLSTAIVMPDIVCV